MVGFTNKTDATISLATGGVDKNGHPNTVSVKPGETFNFDGDPAKFPVFAAHLQVGSIKADKDKTKGETSAAAAVPQQPAKAK